MGIENLNLKSTDYPIEAAQKLEEERERLQEQAYTLGRGLSHEEVGKTEKIQRENEEFAKGPMEERKREEEERKAA